MDEPSAPEDAQLTVLIVNTAFAPDILGGAERSVSELTTSLRSRGHRVVIACLGRRRAATAGDDDRVRRIPSRAFEQMLLPDRSAIRKSIWHATELARVATAIRLRRIIREVRPDVIHFNNLAGFGWLAWVVARSVPTVQTMRDYALLCTSATGQHGDELCTSTHLRCRVLKSPFKLPRLRPSVAVAVSGYTAGRHSTGRVVGSQGDVGTVYNNPADTVDVADQKQANVTGARRVVGFLGRVSVDKGVGVLLDAFARIPAATRPQLLIAGPITAADAELITDRYASLFESGDVQLSGPMDARSFYSQSDIVAVPTQWHEPFGRVAAEALLSGKPLLFSRVGGLPEVIGLYGGRATGVGDFRSADAWASAIVRALEDDYDMRLSHREGPSDPTAEYIATYRRAIELQRASSR